MENKPDHIDELISKYLAGETTPDESAWIEAWIGEHEANRKHVAQFEIIFKRASSIKSRQEFDTDAAWKNVKSKLHQSGGKTVSLPSPSYGYQFFLRIAAGIMLVMGVGFFAYRTFWGEHWKPVEVITRTQTMADTLPDGSSVFLNKETKLDYAFNKKEKTHVVKLKGEAYFHIKHEDDKKFLVEADGLFIRDVGTSFNVTAYPESNTVAVVVVDGEVQFFSAENAGVYLKANGKGVYDKKTKTFTVEQPENNVLAYKTKFFSFSNASLGDVVKALNGVYDKKIVISDRLEKCHLTVSFDQEDIAEIAAVIAETLELKVIERDEQIFLEGKGCEE